MEQNNNALLVTLSICAGVSMTGLGIIWPLVPVYALELGATGFLVGLILSSFNISRTLFSPLVGQLSDKFGRKSFIMAGLFFFAIISLFYVFATNALLLVLVRLFHGTASLFVVPIAMALVVDIAPKKKLGLYMGTLNMAVLIGLGVGPVLGGFLKDNFGLNSAFYTMSGVTVLTLILVIFFIPSDKKTLGKQERQAPSSFKKIMSNKVILGIVIGRFFAASGQGTVYSFLPILGLRIGLTSSQVGIILTTNIFLVALMQRSSGKLADRINPKNMVIYGTFATGLAVFGMPFTEGFILILLLNIVMGIANGFSFPGGLVIIGQYGDRFGSASLMAVSEAAWSLGMIISPILSGILLDLAGVFRMFMIGALLIAIGGIAVTFLLKDYQPDTVDASFE